MSRAPAGFQPVITGGVASDRLEAYATFKTLLL